MHESVKALLPWRNAVLVAAKRMVYATKHQPLTGPVTASMVFTMPRPKSHYRTGKNKHLVKDGAPDYPVGHNLGDLSKLLRATEDSLTDGGVWADDCQVVNYWNLAKVFPCSPWEEGTATVKNLPISALAGVPGVDRLPYTGCVIRVSALGEPPDELDLAIPGDTRKSQ